METLEAWLFPKVESIQLSGSVCSERFQHFWSLRILCNSGTCVKNVFLIKVFISRYLTSFTSKEIYITRFSLDTVRRNDAYADAKIRL